MTFEEFQSLNPGLTNIRYGPYIEEDIIKMVNKAVSSVAKTIFEKSYEQGYREGYHDGISNTFER